MKKEEFIAVYKENITAKGADQLLQYLEKSDFFIAPASSKFHCNYEGGLVEHSLNVYYRLKELIDNEIALGRLSEDRYTEEEIAIAGLLHDLCKVKYYKIDYRNSKNSETGQWEKTPYYTIDELFPYGHGEKSVFLICKYLQLDDKSWAEVSIAINWHMGGFDDRAKGSQAISSAYRKYPLAVYLHTADLLATYIDENSNLNG